MPTYAEQQAVLSGEGVFGPIRGGRYMEGSYEQETSMGAWWSSTARTTVDRYLLIYDSYGFRAGYDGTANARAHGYYVRCVKS